MSRRVYLHIGAPKTGTTYLQDRLSRNAKQLAAHDIHLPTKPLVDSALFQFRAALDLLGQDWGGKPGHAKGSWDALVRATRRTSGTAIISHEILAPAGPDHVAKARAALSAGAELHVVYSARDLARQLPAAWQESIKQGRKWSYARYLNRVQHRDQWFARAFDLPRVLETWGGDLPPERVHVITVPHQRSEALWLRCCAAFGIDPAWAPLDSPKRNQSLGPVETQMIRRFNRRIERETRRESSYDVLIRTMLDEERLVPRGTDRLVLPPRLHPWAEEQAAGWIEWIERTGVHVLGEVEDLRPAPPLSEEEWVDPDQVGPKRQLEAALDALSAMTHEAVRRPDPQTRLRAKIKRVTKSSGV